MTSLHCDSCKLYFKNKLCFQRHLNTARHLQRSTLSLPTHSCICGRMYSYHQSLYAHRKTCAVHKESRSTPKHETEQKDIQAERKTEHEIEIEEFKQKMIKKDAQIESYKKEIDCLKGTILCQKELIQTLEKQIRYGGTMIKSANRRKISPKVRKEIVDQQESKCGGCEAALTEYYEIDHIIGLQFGGTNDTTNLMALCCECHAKKSINENKNRNKIKEAILTILTS